MITDHDERALIQAQSSLRWEVGSEFHWSPPLHQDPDPFLTPSDRLVIFSTARAAMAALRPVLQARERLLKLWIPSYFCMEVATALARDYDIEFYIDDPRDPGPDLDSLTPVAGDCVLVNNTFGIRTAGDWPQLYRHYPDVAFIEDHSHDPTSEWARASEASYCFASIRKTIPLPDGATLWSPRQLPLPARPIDESIAGHRKLAAMLVKASYLAGIDVPKSDYRALQIASEEGLGEETGRRATTLTHALLPHVDVERLRRSRTTNVEHVLARLRDAPTRPTPLFTEWPRGACPFNAVITLPTRPERDSLQRFLAEHHVYAPVHWDLQRGDVHPDHGPSHDLSARILTIPSDYRYSVDTMDRVSDLLLQWAAEKDVAAHSPTRTTR